MLSELLKPATKPLTLRATGSGVQTINLLPPTKTGCLSLYISYNSIKDLTNITQFKNLQVLLMDFNEISSIEDLEPLGSLRYLNVLHLEGNPVCDLPLWDLHVMKLCPKLRVLNGQKTKDFLYDKKQIAHFLELESKFYQFLITSKFVIRVLKLKIMNPRIEMSLATKITQRSMFKDPNFQKNFSNELRSHAAKSSVDGYFCLLRRRILQLQKKISELSVNVGVSSKTHSYLISQLQSISDFDTFTETMQDVHDSALQMIGLGDGPILVIQQNTDQFKLSRMMMPENRDYSVASSQRSPSLRNSPIKSIEDYHPEEEENASQISDMNEFNQNIENYSEEEEIFNTNLNEEEEKFTNEIENENFNNTFYDEEEELYQPIDQSLLEEEEEEEAVEIMNQIHNNIFEEEELYDYPSDAEEEEMKDEKILESLKIIEEEEEAEDLLSESYVEEGSQFHKTDEQTNSQILSEEQNDTFHQNLSAEEDGNEDEIKLSESSTNSSIIEPSNNNSKISNISQPSNTNDSGINVTIPDYANSEAVSQKIQNKKKSENTDILSEPVKAGQKYKLKAHTINISPNQKNINNFENNEENNEELLIEEDENSSISSLSKSSHISQISKASQNSKASQHSKASQNSKASQHSKASQNSKASQHSKTSQNSKASQASNVSQVSKTSKTSKASKLESKSQSQTNQETENIPITTQNEIQKTESSSMNKNTDVPASSSTLKPQSSKTSINSKSSRTNDKSSTNKSSKRASSKSSQNAISPQNSQSSIASFSSKNNNTTEDHEQQQQSEGKEGSQIEARIVEEKKFESQGSIASNASISSKLNKEQIQNDNLGKEEGKLHSSSASKSESKLKQQSSKSDVASLVNKENQVVGDGSESNKSTRSIKSTKSMKSTNSQASRSSSKPKNKESIQKNQTESESASTKSEKKDPTDSENILAAKAKKVKQESASASKQDEKVESLSDQQFKSFSNATAPSTPNDYENDQHDSKEEEISKNLKSQSSKSSIKSFDDSSRPNNEAAQNLLSKSSLSMNDLPNKSTAEIASDERLEEDEFNHSVELTEEEANLTEQKLQSQKSDQKHESQQLLEYSQRNEDVVESEDISEIPENILNEEETVNESRFLNEEEEEKDNHDETNNSESFVHREKEISGQKPENEDSQKDYQSKELSLSSATSSTHNLKKHDVALSEAVPSQKHFNDKKLSKTEIMSEPHAKHKKNNLKSLSRSQKDKMNTYISQDANTTNNESENDNKENLNDESVKHSSVRVKSSQSVKSSHSTTSKSSARSTVSKASTNSKVNSECSDASQKSQTSKSSQKSQCSSKVRSTSKGKSSSINANSFSDKNMEILSEKSDEFVDKLSTSGIGEEEEEEALISSVTINQEEEEHEIHSAQSNPNKNNELENENISVIEEEDSIEQLKSGSQNHSKISIHNISSSSKNRSMKSTTSDKSNSRNSKNGRGRRNANKSANLSSDVDTEYAQSLSDTEIIPSAILTAEKEDPIAEAALRQLDTASDDMKRSDVPTCFVQSCTSMKSVDEEQYGCAGSSTSSSSLEPKSILKKSASKKPNGESDNSTKSAEKYDNSENAKFKSDEKPQRSISFVNADQIISAEPISKNTDSQKFDASGGQSNSEQNIENTRNRQYNFKENIDENSEIDEYSEIDENDESFAVEERITDATSREINSKDSQTKYNNIENQSQKIHFNKELKESQTQNNYKNMNYLSRLRKRTIYVPVNFIPKINDLSSAFATWKSRYKTRIQEFEDPEFTTYNDLLTTLNSKQFEVNERKRRMAASKDEEYRGHQLRQIALKQELKRQIERQKDKNRALRKRLNQYTSENEVLQDFLDTSIGPLSFTISTMSSTKKASPKKTVKKNDLASQYCAMLREKRS